MKIRLLLVCLAASLLLVQGCGKKDEASSATAPVPEAAMPEPVAKPGLLKVGVEACDKFLTKYRDCQAQLPTALKETMKPGIEQTEKTWIAEAAKPENHERLSAACKELDASVADAMRAQGCMWYRPVAEQ